MEITYQMRVGRRARSPQGSDVSRETLKAPTVSSRHLIGERKGKYQSCFIPGSAAFTGLIRNTGAGSSLIK